MAKCQTSWLICNCRLQILRDDITERYRHRIDKQGNEDASIPPKEGKPRALSSFLGNEEEDM